MTHNGTRIQVRINEGYALWWLFKRYEEGDEVEIPWFVYLSDPVRFQMIDKPSETNGGDHR